jgi:hypothetical protein
MKSPSSCAQCSSQHPNLSNPPACPQFPVLRSSVGVSEVMQVAPSSSTCRNDRDALLCRAFILHCLEAKHAPVNRLRHRRVGSRLLVAPLNLSDPIYIQKYVLYSPASQLTRGRARRTFVTRSRDLLESCRSSLRTLAHAGLSLPRSAKRQPATGLQALREAQQPFAQPTPGQIDKPARRLAPAAPSAR